MLSPVHAARSLRSVSPAENRSKTDMCSHSLLSRLAYTLCIMSPNVGASRMAYLCRPLLDCPHVFSQEVAVWVDRFGLRTRTSSGKPREPSHKQGMQGHDIIHQNTSYTTSYNPRGACNGRRLRITDLRIYPPPSPSSRAPRRRAPANQVTAGLTHVRCEGACARVRQR